MALNSVKICNMALIRIGAAPISSFDENSNAAKVCGVVYQNILETSLSENKWRFAVKKQKLSRLTATPLNEWKYAHQLPTDMIGGVFAIFSNNSTLLKSYEIFSDKVYSDYPELFADYAYTPDERRFPSYFTEYLVLLIASAIAVPITDQVNLSDYFAGLAEKQRLKALYSDSSQQPPQQLQDFSLVDVRA